MDTLYSVPKYEFVETGVGCADHRDPDCLCDVHIRQTTPIVVNIHHMFHSTALDAVDADGVSNRNFGEFMQVVLGLWEMFMAANADDNMAGRLRPLCVVCQKPMVAESTTRKTCSQSCRNKKSRLERKARENAI